MLYYFCYFTVKQVKSDVAGTAATHNAPSSVYGQVGTTFSIQCDITVVWQLKECITKSVHIFQQKVSWLKFHVVLSAITTGVRLRMPKLHWVFSAVGLSLLLCSSEASCSQKNGSLQNNNCWWFSRARLKNHMVDTCYNHHNIFIDGNLWKIIKR